MSTIPQRTDFNISKVKAKYDNAISKLEEFQRKSLDSTNTKQQVLVNLINDAGVNLSDAIEYAIKLHIQNNWSILPNSLINLYDHFKLPEAIEQLYCDSSGSKGLLYNQKCLHSTIEPNSIKFDIIRDRKAYSNNTHHSGIDLTKGDVDKIRAEVKKFINCYLDPSPLREEDDFKKYPEFALNMYNDVDAFQGTDTAYVFVVGKKGISDFDRKALARVNWEAIVDFNRDSFNNNNFGTVYGKERLSLLLLPSNIDNLKNTLIHSDYNPIYYMADGADWDGQSESCNYYNWLRTRKAKLDKFLRNSIENIANKGVQSLVFVSIHPEQSYNKVIIESVLSLGFTNISFRYYCFCNDAKELEAQYKPDVLQSKCQIGELAEILNSQLKEPVWADKSTRYNLPHRHEDSSAKGFITQTEYMSFTRFMDILTLSDPQDTDKSKKDFYQGSTICPWIGIENRWPVPNRQTDSLIKTIRNWIESGEKIGVMNHKPGAGGTTIARTAAWHLHTDFVVAWLRHNDQSLLPTMFENLYDSVKWPVLVFVEIPQVMEFNELKSLANSINSTKNIFFIAISRERFITHNKSITIMDWGNNMPALVDAYEPFLDEMNYENDIYKNKSSELERLRANATIEEKCPFIVGLTTFDKDYEGIKGYVANFKSLAKNNSKIADALSILAICDIYNRPDLPSQFFKPIFSMPPDKPFSLKEPLRNIGAADRLVEEVIDGSLSSWRIKHPAFDFEILRCFAGLNDNDSNYKEIIYQICRKLIAYCKEASTPNGVCPDGLSLYENILIGLLIERNDRQGERYSQLVQSLSDINKVNVFTALHDAFPNNPHFCSHLARCYSRIEKDQQKALDMANKAIELCDDDPVLFHMRAECYRNLLEDKLTNRTEWKELEYPSEGLSIHNFVSKAGADYMRCIELERRINRPTAYGYSGYIKLLITVIDYAKKHAGIDYKKLLTSLPFAEWWETVQSMVEELESERNLLYTDNPEKLDADIVTHKADLYNLIEEYQQAIQIIENELSKHPTPQLRRISAMFRIHYGQDKRKNYKNNIAINTRLCQMLEINLDEQFSRKDFHAWLEVVRYSEKKITDVLDKINSWRASSSEEVDILEFYRFVLNVLRGYDGSSPAVVEAIKALRICQRIRPNFIKILEYTGDGVDGAMIKGAITPTDKEAEYTPYEGVVTSYIHPGRAFITVKQLGEDLHIFFSPKMNKLDDTCLNHSVEFCMGFSYDGLRAVDVKLIRSTNRM